MINFILSAIWFLITVGVIVNIWQQTGFDTLKKLLWTAGVVMFPFLGSIIYMLTQRKN
ncbi:MAG: PLDc N-terminal domain-containing protein [Bacteroidota bacterium]